MSSHDKLCSKTRDPDHGCILCVIKYSCSHKSSILKIQGNDIKVNMKEQEEKRINKTQRAWGPKRTNTSNKLTRETQCPWTSQKNHCIIFMLKTKLEHTHTHTLRSADKRPAKGRLWQEMGQGRAGRPGIQSSPHFEQQNDCCCSEIVHALLTKKLLSSMVQSYEPLVFRCPIMEV